MTTHPAIARRLGISPEKVRGWISRGELAAVNVADRSDGTPRWKVSEEALAAFLATRTAKPAPKSARRAKREPYHRYV